MYQGSVRKVVSLANAIILALIVVNISMPQVAYSSPIRFSDHAWTVTIPSAGRVLQFSQVPGGIAYVDLNDSSFSGELSYGLLQGLHLKHSQKRDNTLVGTASFPDHFGGRREIDVVGNVDAGNTQFRGLMMVDGGEPLDIEVELDGEPTASTQVVIVVILSAAAVVAIACVIGNSVVNCGDRCAVSCGDSGVDTWNETCGSCKCVCK